MNAEYIIVGAGLAGVSIAHKLARRNIPVIILESGTVASGTSSNPSAILYPYFTAQYGERFKYYSDGLHNALSFLYECSDVEFHKCGIIHLGLNKNSPERWLHKSAELFTRNGHDCHFLNPQETSKTAGIELLHQSVYLENSGILNMPSLVNNMLKNSNIEVLTGQYVQRYSQSGLEVEINTESAKFKAKSLIITTGSNTGLIPQSLHSRFKLVHGQTSIVPENDLSYNLQHVICSSNSLTPAINGVHHIGATHNEEFIEGDPIFNEQDGHMENLGRVAKYSPEIADSFQDSSMSSWCGVRLVSDNKMPIICRHPEYENVSFSIAHGSRGSISCLAGNF